MKATAFEAILTQLAQAHVEFVLIGGVAALAHGVARVTFDLDLCYRRTPENIARLCEVVGGWHPTLRDAPPDLPFAFDTRTVQAGLNFTLSTDWGDLDLLGEVIGLGAYETVQAVAETLIVYDQPLQVLTLEGLLTAKRAAGRPKDLEVIHELEALRALRRPSK